MKLLYRLVFFVGFLAIFAFIIAYARGYRLDLQKKSVTPTGIISITSDPQAAKIYINNQLKGVTDSNLTFPPGSYQIDIKKEGYTSFSKKINLRGELVASIDAVLFPLNPTLSPLTNLGLIKAVPVDDTEKVIIFLDKGVDTQNDEKNGIYLFDGGKKPLPFFPPLKPIILKSNLPEGTDLSTAQVIISPDTKEAIFEFGKENARTAYLLSLEQENLTPFEITASKNTLITAWEKQKHNDDFKILETYPVDFTKIASSSVDIISFSPSETKVLYQANQTAILPPMITPPLIATNQTDEQRSLQKGKIYVYDKKEDKNFLIDVSLPKDASVKDSIQWYFDSRHLLINQGKKIVVVDYDDTNEQTVYSGPYEQGFFATTSDGKIITLSNLNPGANEWPDLYLVGTR